MAVGRGVYPTNCAFSPAPRGAPRHLAAAA
jgi:hypothetical protein